MKLEDVPGVFAVCRLDPDAVWEMPSRGGFVAVTRTADELSVVCEESAIPSGAEVERGWRCLRVAGSIPFERVGVLASLTKPLAEANISVFAISTFDTDYMLVKSHEHAAAISRLRSVGFTVDCPS